MEAQQAAVANDSAKMHHFGKQAVERLTNLPATNPETFAVMVEGMSDAERKAIKQDAKGEWIVTIPGRQPMPYGVELSAGLSVFAPARERGQMRTGGGE